MGENCEKQFFVNNLMEELHMKWKFGMTAPASNTSRAAGRSLKKTTTSTKASS
jgi:hypothetical protein